MPHICLPTILVVEDDPFDVWLLRNSLAAVGADHPVAVCVDGREAIAWLRSAAKKDAARRRVPALMLIDLRLPGIDGLALIRWAREQRAFARTTIAVVSGTPDPADVKRAFDAGADHFIAKPADAGTVQQLLDEAGLLPAAITAS
jgi:two-component system, response regulator